MGKIEDIPNEVTPEYIKVRRTLALYTVQILYSEHIPVSQEMKIITKDKFRAMSIALSECERPSKISMVKLISMEDIDTIHVDTEI